MAEAILVEVAKSLVLNLGNLAYEEISFACGLKTQLDKLKKTVDAIAALLLDADEAPHNSHSDRHWFDSLRSAVYEADDLFDEINTIAERKKLMEGGPFTKEVRLFFSSSNQLVSCFKAAQRVKAIRNKLADISGDRRDFSNMMRPVVRIAHEHRDNDLNFVGGFSRETYSFVDGREVIGRDLEKNVIISMLLEEVEEVVSVIPIVGVGGLGKTTLAQLVYHDEGVRQKFDLMLWVCVPHEIKLKEVIENIIASATGGERPSNYNLEQLTDHLSRQITGKKYMLVLDDVWDEDPGKWERLKALLTCGAARGSKIVVTSRSLAVGRIMGTIPPFELKPLNKDDSWSLFEKTVFCKEGHEPGVRELGREILRLCQNVPLAIRAIAGVLANKLTVREWSLFVTDELANLELYDDDVMPILKLSYDHLRPKLKACFAYCSLFPRGYIFDKSKLVSVWIAQGFVEPPRSKTLSLEDVGQQYLEDLLNKSLLQGCDSRSACKLHDLMYDLCCSVGEGQCQMVCSGENSVGRSICHVSIGYPVDVCWNPSASLGNIKQLRTFLMAQRPCFGMKMSKPVCERLISSFSCLRALDLHSTGIEELPTSIGKLIHLRYLDLSGNYSLKELPNALTLLHNLQHLDLRDCKLIPGLPRDLKKLVNLRHLLVKCKHGMYSPIYFPSGLRKLTNLQTLDRFCVAENDPHPCVCGSDKSTCSRLSDLNPLNNLKGKLSIHISRSRSYPNMALDAREANLEGKKNLENLQIVWGVGEGEGEEDEMVFENLQLHCKLSKLLIDSYRGVKLPSWMSTDQLLSSLPLLTSITIKNCGHVRHLPSFAQLPNLKALSFNSLPCVEYIEGTKDAEPSSSSSPSSKSSATFFPSLTDITLIEMEKLKGWGRSSAAANLSFCGVSYVTMWKCQCLEYMPLCPNVEYLTLLNHMNEKLQLLKPHISSSWVPKLKVLRIGNLNYLASLPRECVQQVSELHFVGWNSCSLQNSSELGLKGLEDLASRAFEGMTSVRTLVFNGCQGFVPICYMAHQIKAVERIKFSFSMFDDGGIDDSCSAWKLLKHLHSVTIDCVHPYTVESVQRDLRGLQYVASLRSLEFTRGHALEAIPDWLGSLQSLETLEFHQCILLASFPEEMQRLTNLKLLVIDNCPKLAPRCRRDIGEDWAKIQHIPEIIVRM